MAFYQRENSGAQERYDYREYEAFRFPVHLHRHPELALCFSGQTVLEVDGRRETMRAGQAALILPSRPHAYEGEAGSRIAVVVFSVSCAQDFFQAVRGLSGEKAVFSPGKACFEAAAAFLHPENNRYTRQAGLYALCGCCLEQVRFVQADAGEGPLRRVLAEVDARFAEELTLRALAGEMGYDWRYLSRCVNRGVGMNFRRLLTMYRLDRARELLTGTGASVEDVARLSGFGGTRQMDRAFSALLGRTPGSFRRAGGEIAPFQAGKPVL